MPVSHFAAEFSACMAGFCAIHTMFVNVFSTFTGAFSADLSAEFT